MSNSRSVNCSHEFHINIFQISYEHFESSHKENPLKLNFETKISAAICSALLSVTALNVYLSTRCVYTRAKTANRALHKKNRSEIFHIS